MKQCAKCREWKLVDDFHNDSARKDGKYPNCRICHRTYMRDRHQRHDVKMRHSAYGKQRRLDPEYRQQSIERSAQFYASIKGRAQTLYRGALRRDPNATLTLDHIISMIERGVCPITGMSFVLIANHRANGKTAMHPYAPSIDQIEANGGYTNENTRVVIWQYNWMKGQLTDDEMLIICHAVVENAK